MAAAKYLHGLDDGEIPILLLFSGTVFRDAPRRRWLRGVARGVARGGDVPAARGVWRDVMDRYFPNSGWIRVSRDTLDVSTRFKAARALPTWEEAFEHLLKEAGEEGV